MFFGSVFSHAPRKRIYREQYIQNRDRMIMAKLP